MCTISRGIGIMVLAVGGLIVGINVTGGGSKADSKNVHVSDIPKRVKLIGTLNYPLGELVDVRGVWREPKGTPMFEVKDPELEFQVVEVNGRPVNPPVIFLRYNVQQVTTPSTGRKPDHRATEIAGDCEVLRLGASKDFRRPRWLKSSDQANSCHIKIRMPAYIPLILGFVTYQ